MCAHRFRILVAVATAMTGVACGVFGPSEDFVEVEGTVWARCVHQSTTVAGPCTYQDAVAGAVVSTSLDSKTATTDASGKFRLVTSTGPAKDYGCKVYTLTITAAGHPTYSRSGAWGSHPVNQTFTLATGEPTIVGAGITPC
jgi:hypothetical protein